MRGRKLIWTLCVLTAAFVIPSSLADAVAATFDQAHAPFAAVLKQHVREGRVDYAALKADPKPLDACLSQLAAVSEKDFKSWPEKQQLAFLINAYNAYTLKLVVDHYPVKSIKDIGGLLSGPWDQKIARLFGRTFTLDDIEHGMIRKSYSEPRIHFALVCAAKGCPALRGEPYVAGRLDEQLDDQARQFLANTQKNRVDAGQRVVYLSPLFKWYGADFEKKSGSVLKFLGPYWPEKARQDLRDDFKIQYTNYDWSLNSP